MTQTDSGIRVTYRTIGGAENQVTVNLSDLTQ